jgi:hypothetical protein
MDPISLIIAALSAGAAAAAKDAAADVITDAYAGFKALIRRRFGGNSEAETTLEHAERQPDADTAGLAQQLRAAGADRDKELLTAAQALLQQLDPAGSAAGKYTVKYDVAISGGKGIVVGDNANTTMTFNERD